VEIAVFTGGGSIAPHVMAGFVDAFKMLGHKVFVFDLTTNDPQQQYQRFSSLNPDVAIGYGSTALITVNGQYFFRQRGIRTVLLHYDAPCYVLSREHREEIAAHPGYYLNLVWDRRFLDMLFDDGFRDLHPIKLAADPALFFPGNRTPAVDAVAFVGTLAAAAGAQTPAPKGRDEFINLVIGQKIECIGVPVTEIIESLLQDPQFQPITQAYRRDRQLFWTDYHLVHGRGSAAIRSAYIGAVRERPLDLYADCPAELPGITFHGPVDYRRALRKVYASHAVNLNISALQLETSVNNRVFDCFASGGFLLSDYKSDMREIFPDFWEEITFTCIREMNEKISYYLVHAAAREELTRRASDTVMAEHTYEKRAEYLLGLLN
jgi:spore maturation protein CgeB